MKRGKESIYSFVLLDALARHQLSPNQHFLPTDQAHDSHHLHLQDWRQAGRG